MQTATPHKLTDLTLAELKAAWAALCRHPLPPQTSREFLIRHLSWQHQAATHRGLSRAIERQLLQLAAAFERDPHYRPSAARPPIKPSTQFVRLWQGEVHKVAVASEGFVYRSARYASLSAIA